MSQALVPLCLPLRQTSLIEASAGTGKTYTLAMLYVRLILNHGGKNAFGRPLLPREILVVTFTKAATRELRDRIRARLVETAEFLSNPTTSAKAATAPDPLLFELCQDYQEINHRLAAARHLTLAAETMDEAAIATIHAWCARVLSEYALYYGGAFEHNSLESENELLRLTCNDFWRMQVLPMSTPSLAHMMEQFNGPDGLLTLVNGLLIHIDSLGAPAQNLDELIADFVVKKQAHQGAIDQAKARLTPEMIDAIEAWFLTAEKANQYKKPSLNANNKAKAFVNLRAYLLDSNTELNQGASIKRIALLDRSIWKDPDTVNFNACPCEPLAVLLTLLDQSSQLNIKDDILTYATHWIKHRLDQQKQQHNQLSQDDFLQHLQRALASDQGKTLATAIRQNFPITMVDEFQDTDSTQYDIFRRIYRLGQSSSQETQQEITTGFIMIGDPKQAIYAFRGGDIHTYLRAKADTQGNLYTLTHNYRSDKQVIASVNRLFTYGDQHALGAFRFRKDEDNPLPFLPVQAGSNNTNKQLIIGRLEGEQAQAALNAWITPDMLQAEDFGKKSTGPKKNQDKAKNKALTEKHYIQHMATATANEIAHLLNLAAQGQAHLVDTSKGASQTLQPKDLAILVADKKEARKIRQALSQCNIASVYLSDRSSIYQTPIAKDLLYVLRAIVRPDADRLLSIALATQLIGLSLVDLDLLQRNELAWETQTQRFAQYATIWRDKDILACIYQIIFDSQTASRFHATPEGERSLTDLLHLSELLQQTAMQSQGESALVSHLETQIDNADTHDSNQQQRLESDRNLVQVVTIHKAKGLEYPLAFLPFICRTKKVSGKHKGPLVYTTPQGKKVVRTNKTDEVITLVEQERQTEEIRKLYVALTRASHCQYLGLGNVKNIESSGFGGLLMLDGSQDNFSQRIAELSDAITQLPLPSAEKWQDSVTAEHLQPARTALPLTLESWRISSYSALSFSGNSSNKMEAKHNHAPDSAQLTIFQEEQEISEQAFTNPTQPDGQPPNMHNLAKGALYGTMLHEVLEWCAGVGFANAITCVSQRQQMLHEKLTPLQLLEWLPALNHWLCNYLQTPWQLDQLGCSTPLHLAQLQPQQAAVEMEFIVAIHHLDIQALDAIVCQYIWPHVERPKADAKQINGLMKGFIDLLVEHNGQFFVIDWKSNYLGVDTNAYHHNALQSTLLSKRYDMQYAIYLLALHRLLQLRLPNYDYNKHIGGAIYAFLRGSEHLQTQGLIMEKPSHEFILAMDALFKGTLS